MPEAGYALACRAATSLAMTSMPTPPILVAVPLKYLSTKSVVQADGLEDLGAAVGGDGGDAHLGHDLQDALAERVDQVADGLLGLDARQEGAGADQVLDGLHRQVRVDGGGAVADEQGDVVHLADVAGLDQQAHLGALLGADEVVVDGRGEQQRRDRRVLGVGVPVGQDDAAGRRPRWRRRPRRRSRSMRAARASPPPATRYRPDRVAAFMPGMSPSALMWMSLASSSLSITGKGRVTLRQDGGGRLQQVARAGRGRSAAR